MTAEPTRVTVLGLGEAGALLAADLARTTVVCGYDPADVPTPPGVERHEVPETAVTGSGLVLAVTAASDARRALTQAGDAFDDGAVYADLSTATPGLKAELGAIAEGENLLFADVALMAPVPGNGLATASLASGPGASGYAQMINHLGGDVEVLSGHAGDAAAHKLLRSVVTKGLAALVIESLAAAAAHGSADRVWDHLVELVTAADGSFLRRLIAGTPRHVERRIVEMEAARDFLLSLDVPPTMTIATVDTLRHVRRRGIPDAVQRPAEE